MNDENRIVLPDNFWEVAPEVLKNIPEKIINTYTGYEIGIVVECSVLYGNPAVMEMGVVSLSENEKCVKARLTVCGFYSPVTMRGFINEIRSLYRRDDSLRIVAFQRRKKEGLITQYVDFDLGNFLILGKVWMENNKDFSFEHYK